MKKRLCICFIMMLLLIPKEEVYAKMTNVEEYESCFCDGHELTNKERCEELLIKILTDEKNWFDDGLISKEVYELQIEPVNKALDYLEIASKREVDILYKEVLLLNSDWLEADIEAGEEIDEGFYQYIEEELKRMN